MTEKVKNRLEQLDDFEEVSTLEIISGLLADLKYLLKQPERHPHFGLNGISVECQPPACRQFVLHSEQGGGGGEGSLLGPVGTSLKCPG